MNDSLWVISHGFYRMIRMIGFTSSAPGIDRSAPARESPTLRARSGAPKIIPQCPQCPLWSKFFNFFTGSWHLANGIDHRTVFSDHRKSISEERTFEVDQQNIQIIDAKLFEIADDLTRKLRNENLKGRTIVLKIRLEGFETYTRSRTLKCATDETREILTAARKHLETFDRQGKAVRLIGISISKLENAAPGSPGQLDLFAKTDPGKKAMEDQVLDSLKRKFGSRVNRAALLLDK